MLQGLSRRGYYCGDKHPVQEDRPELEEDIREILKGLEAGVHHEFVRLMELDGCGPEIKKGSGSGEESRRRSEAREVVRMVCRMRFRR
jgi:hypothetical protein